MHCRHGCYAPSCAGRRPCLSTLPLARSPTSQPTKLVLRSARVPVIYANQARARRYKLINTTAALHARANSDT